MSLCFLFGWLVGLMQGAECDRGWTSRVKGMM